MMDFRQKLEHSRKLSPVEITGEEEPYECSYFATERGRSPICLELRLSEGTRKAMPYSSFIEITQSIDLGIEIITTQKRIRIKGRNLDRLFEYLSVFRVRHIEANIGMDSKEEGLFVSEILIEPLPFA